MFGDMLLELDQKMNKKEMNLTLYTILQMFYNGVFMRNFCLPQFYFSKWPHLELISGFSYELLV